LILDFKQPMGVVNVELYDVNGVLLLEENWAGEGQMELALEGLVVGFYELLVLYYGYYGKISFLSYVQWDHKMKGNMALRFFGYWSLNYFLYLLCLSFAHWAIWTTENIVNR